MEEFKSGKIQEINWKTGEITFIKNIASENINIGDRFYVNINGKILQLQTTFPMMTIIRCKPYGINRAMWKSLKKDMNVYRYNKKDNTSDNAKIHNEDYKVGDKGPAGGWIFYDKGNSDNGWRYLEASPHDLSTGISWSNGKSIETGATDEAVGSGKSNTDKIIRSQGSGEYAAKICAGYRGGSKNDWFLPSKDELNLMFNFFYKNSTEGLTESYYWSSSESRITHAWYQGVDFSNPTIKYTTNSVRAIRAFSE
jgi:hypothetical protein